MLTSRAWWFLLTVFVVLLGGILFQFVPVTLLGLTLFLWFCWEWLAFAVRSRTVLRRLRVEREVADERGPVATLWAGRTFRVRVRLVGYGLPFLAVTDLVPFGVEFVDGSPAAEGEVSGARQRPRDPGRRPGLSDGAPAGLELTYRIRCTGAGLARFEGLFVQAADLQGFFYHAAFVRAPAVLRVLPRLREREGHRPSVKRNNLLPPPGIHRLRRAGSGSELLDLRDYLPGDPPRTIAWKVSARRDRLITKEFESEVPVRCTLFVDTSNSVLVRGESTSGEGRGKKALATRHSASRLVDLAASILQANAGVRDLTGLCLFDEHGVTAVRPDRTGTHQTRMLHLLADAAARSPAVSRIDPDNLLPLAYAFARTVYPDLLAPALNAVPFWLTWLVAFPGYRRRRRTLREALYQYKRLFFFLSSSALFWLVAGLFPLSLYALWYPLNLLRLPPALALVLTFLGALVLPVALPASWYLLTLLLNRRAQRLAAWRKRLAALLSVRYGLAPGGLGALLEDDDQLALLLQRFLAEHQVPYTLPLYDETGRYLFACPEKIEVLARTLLQAVARGRDNELFVLLADLLELDDRLGPLLQAVRVALSRHHQVVLVCPWPPGLALPGGADQGPDEPRPGRLADVVGQATTARFQAAYHRVRRTFARLGVPVVCAASDEPVALVQDRLDRLRAIGGKR
jgi:uncharacterized protein (DUF58 family)